MLYQVPHPVILGVGRLSVAHVGRLRVPDPSGDPAFRELSPANLVLFFPLKGV